MRGMRARIQTPWLASWLLLGLWSVGVFAATHDDRILTSAVVGRWISEDVEEDGVTTTTDVTFSADGTYKGQLVASDGTCWTFTGKWSIEGGVLVWQYENSSLPMPAELRTDKDIVESVDAHTLVLRSTSGDARHVMVRRQE